MFPNPIKTFSISSTSLFCRALPSATFTSKRTELFRLSVPCLPRYHHNQQILTLFFRKRGGPAQKVSVITIDIYKILTRSRRGESALKLSIIISDRHAHPHNRHLQNLDLFKEGGGKLLWNWVLNLTILLNLSQGGAGARDGWKLSRIFSPVFAKVFSCIYKNFLLYLPKFSLVFVKTISRRSQWLAVAIGDIWGALSSVCQFPGGTKDPQ